MIIGENFDNSLKSKLFASGSIMEILSKAEKKERVIKLYKEGKKYQEIVKEVRISPRDIGRIINEYTEEKDTKHSKSYTTNGYKLLLEGLHPIEVAIKLKLPFEQIRKIYLEYLDLSGLQNFEEIYISYKNYMPLILQIIDKIKHEKISIESFNNFCKYIEDIPALERRWSEKLLWDKFMTKREN